MGYGAQFEHLVEIERFAECVAAVAQRSELMARPSYDERQACLTDGPLAIDLLSLRSRVDFDRAIDGQIGELLHPASLYGAGLFGRVDLLRVSRRCSTRECAPPTPPTRC